MTGASALVAPSRSRSPARVITTASAVVFIALADRGARGDARQSRTPGWSSSSPSRRCSCSGCCSSRSGCGCSGASSRAIRARPPIGRSSTSAAPASAGPRSSSRRSPPSTSSSCCWRATAACTGWSRRRSAARCATRRCSRSSPAWQRAAHARIACVECHIGEGAAGFVHAKLSGVRQLVHVAINAYPRPIPPGAEMRPGARRRPAGAATSPGAGSAIASASFASMPTTKRTPRRRRCCRCTWAPRPSSAPRDSLACGSRRSASSTSRPMPERQTIPYVKVTDAQGTGEGIRRDRHARTDDQRGRAPHDGLRRLPQHGRPSDLADARAGRGQAIAAGR